MWQKGVAVTLAMLLSAGAAQAQLLDVRQTIYGMD